MTTRLPPGYTHPVLLGKGACGTVYRVRQTGLDRLVALKILPLSNRGDRERLLAEARIQSHIRLSCIPQIYDAFQWRNTICLVMEWIHGVPLSAIAHTAFPPVFFDRTIALFCNSLASLHSLAIAHRDLKPHNIIVTADRGVMLVDLGFARGPRDEAEPASRVRGTVRYMAPEVRHGRTEIDWIRADVYAAGIIVRDLLRQGSAMTLPGTCIADDPNERPADGEAFGAELKSDVSFPRTPGNQPEVALLAATYLCERLDDAAVSLLDQRRSQEAYWLLVESLELDPDNSRTLQLMADFNRRSARPHYRRRLITAGATALVVVLGIGVVYEAGRRSGSDTLPSTAGANRSPSRATAGNAPLLQPHPGHRFVMASGPIIREIKPATGVISGRLDLVGWVAGWRIEIDGAIVHGAPVMSVVLAAGEHDIRASAPDGMQMLRERVRLLPFEEKTVVISPR